MDRRFALFAVLVALIFVVNQVIFSVFFPPPPPNPADKKVAQANADKKKAAPEVQAAPDKEAPPGDPAKVDDAKPADDDKPAEDAKPGEVAKPDEAIAQVPEASSATPQRGTLGSGDNTSPYRMLVTWNNVGASIERVELNSPDYRALDDRSGARIGYLGYLAPADAPKRSGALVRVVGQGTPAKVAGLEPGDVVTAVGERKIQTAKQLLDALQTTEPGQSLAITVKRGDEDKRLTAALARRPLDVIRAEFETGAVEIVKPGDHDPLSFLATIQQFDDRTLANDNQELGGVQMRNAPWEVVSSDQEKVVFRQLLSKLDLEITKTYRLATVPTTDQDNATYPAYHLNLEITVANVGDKSHKVAYRLDGPNGLPIEGEWYASKVSRSWGSAGLRDVIVQFNGGTLEQVAPSQLAEEDYKKDWGATSSLDYIAVDAQYFAAALIPKKSQPDEILFQSIMPKRAGAVPAESANIRLMNVSFRLDSELAELAPGGKPLAHQFQIFVGPKRPALLAQYGPPGGTLKDLVYYGWFGPIARVLGEVLHFFYLIVANYGLAIIMLTVLVRGCMFPLSRKQALGAQKMQELQPEMKKISEKYKADPQKRTQATQELFRKHKYNPVGGCLLAFAQLPIFVGLYRSLMVDIELRQAPLFSESIRWASNLAAPDMLWNWEAVMPEFITRGTGIFGLGPFLNILPLVTIALFIWQQKMFMPPPADEQAAMQQKMMKYMMIFMGVLFFKVASGLCVYFIASSLWGIAERKLLPKAKKTDPIDAASPSVSPTPTGGNGAAPSKKRQRGRK